MLGSNRIDAAKARLQARLDASATANAAVKQRKTVKGQRAAKAAVETAVPTMHECFLPDFDSFENVCQACESHSGKASAIAAWTLPVTFKVWAKHFRGADATTIDQAIADSKFDLVIEYKRYRDAQFGSAIRFDAAGSFEKIVNRQIARERSGKANLGLLGYSAIDIAQIAVFNAWVRQIGLWLEQTGADKHTVKLISQALRDRRSDDELRADAHLGENKRITFGSDGRLRHQDQSAAVRKARQFLAARRLFKQYPVSGYAAEWLPTAGAVYREVGAVIYEGLRQFNNSLEGLTPEGIMGDDVFFNASTVEATTRNVAASITAATSYEPGLFDFTLFDEVALTRTAKLNVLREQIDASLLPAEINALTLVELLVEGESLLFIREVFSEVSNRTFNSIVRDAEFAMNHIDEDAVTIQYRKLVKAALAA